MIKVLEKEKDYVIVKMDIVTYDKINKEKKEEGYFDDLIEEARNSKAYATVDELFYDLEN